MCLLGYRIGVTKCTPAGAIRVPIHPILPPLKTFFGVGRWRSVVAMCRNGVAKNRYPTSECHDRVAENSFILLWRIGHIGGWTTYPNCLLLSQFAKESLENIKWIWWFNSGTYTVHIYWCGYFSVYIFVLIASQSRRRILKIPCWKIMYFRFFSGNCFYIKYEGRINEG